MKKSITLKGVVVEYHLKRYARSRRVNMIAHHDGTLVVTAPLRYPVYFIKQVLHKNASWILSQQHRTACKNNVTIEPAVVAHIREHVRQFVMRACLQFNAHYGFCYNRVSVRHQKTRWGSCSISGNLNFNLRMVYLPQALREYIVVHELCHLQEMNHSKAFWALVAQQIPDYQNRRKALRRYTQYL